VLGRKIVIHESNRIPGKCTRLLAHLANGILLPHGVDLERKSFAKKTVHVSIPLRREIGKMDRRSARENLHLNPDMATVVVLGGSQGADVLNGWARESMELLNWHGIAVCCVCGILSAGSEVIRGKSSDGKTIANVFMPFCDDMRSLLNGADLMVCRAGASTIAEAAALSIPMVLVPYAHAADGHQLANAMHAEGNGQAIVVLEENISTAGKMVLKFLLEKSRAPAAGAVTGERERSAVAVADYVENIVNGW
jgi:UDP-N-acetylglucosamine--N-acetylmuramyl-(pentapeptide) pyrophosphoryl-undecaprenol N-acetylglucosamine transferase